MGQARGPRVTAGRWPRVGPILFFLPLHFSFLPPPFFLLLPPLLGTLVNSTSLATSHARLPRLLLKTSNIHNF
jgi:hypothetical protein